MTHKRKEILFILNSLEAGGAEKVFIDLLKHFDYKKYNVTLLLIYKCGHHLSNVPQEVNVVSLFDRPKLRIENYVAYYLKAAYHKILHYQFCKKIGDMHFDAVISYTEGYPVLLQSFIKDSTCNRIAWVHCDLNSFHWCAHHFKSKAQEVEIYKRMNHIICVSNDAKNGFYRFLESHRPIEVIYNVIDRVNIMLRAKQSISVHRRKFTICHIGRLIPVKRQERIVYLASELKRRGYDLDIWILGSGPRESELKALTARLNLTDVVHFLGFQSNPYPYLAASDVFVLTSDTEGYPTVICEAICLGIPVLSTNISGATEILNDGSGILTSFDISNIADSVEELITQPETYQYYVARAIEKSKQYNPQIIISQIEDLIET